MRKTRMTIAVLALFLPLMASAQDATEETLNELARNWEEGWNIGDASAIGQLYTEDADFAGIDGQAAKGRAAIEEMLDGFLTTVYKGSKLSITTTETRAVKPHLIIGDSVWELTDVPAESEGAPTKGQATVIMKQVDGQWLIVSHQSRIPVMSPGGEPQ